MRQLGEGGMGQVWEAQDTTLGRPVAVKVISLLAGGGSRGNEARARFLREARITAQLQHPNIVTIHDLGEADIGDDKAPFLVMELIRGEGLDALLRRGTVPLPDTARWGAQICDALAAAHDMGVMHRDIKPSNILITPSGLVKVLDFGIARAADPHATADRLTQTGFIVGTPPYMAPEQARGFPEPHSDLYVLGCLLFELITGRLPFQAPDTVGYLSAHRLRLFVVMTVTLVLTAVLTSRSTKLTRGAGYAASTVIAVGLLADVIDKQGSWNGDGWYDGILYDSPYTLHCSSTRCVS
ncbi:serine/threonine-protein kinase [Streptomyces lavendulae]|uniref:serine/threonine-protein kinase n=1 Tax=Streptomyces lavendulae TaxID=1914 RepID=UPI0036E9B652